MLQARVIIDRNVKLQYIISFIVMYLLYLGAPVFLPVITQILHPL